MLTCSLVASSVYRVGNKIIPIINVKARRNTVTGTKLTVNILQHVWPLPILTVSAPIEYDLDKYTHNIKRI